MRHRGRDMTPCLMEDRLLRQRDDIRTADDKVSCDQWNPMHDARCGDELIRRIALEIQAGRSERHREVDGPYVDPTQNAGDFPVLEVHLDATELKELRHLPEHDGGDGPSPSSEQGLLVRPELAAEGEDQLDVTEVSLASGPSPALE